MLVDLEVILISDRLLGSANIEKAIRFIKMHIGVDDKLKRCAL